MPTLFDALQIGDLTLQNRIVMAPLTRMRAFNARSPGTIHARHYSQRATAGLIITEATSVSPQGVGYPNTPGLWSEDQVAAWSDVTAAVHDANGLPAIRSRRDGFERHVCLFRYRQRVHVCA